MEAYKLNNGRWIIADWDDNSGQYTAPMNEHERELTGCHTYCSRSLEGLGVHSYSTKASALRWARE